MAESITYAEGEQAQQEREAEFGRQDAKYKNQQRNHENDLKRRTQTGVTTPTSVASQAAQSGYVKVWQFTQEAVEDLALSFVDFMIISGPLVMILFFLRLVVGNMLNGGSEINYKGVRVPFVPPMGIVEGIFRSGKFLFISIISLTVYATGGTVLYVLTNPVESLSILSELVKSIGLGNIIGLTSP